MGFVLKQFLFSGKDKVLCKACDVEELPKKMYPGNIFLEIGLWLIAFPVGAIYTFYRLGTRYWSCSACGSEDIILASSQTVINHLGENSDDIPV